MGKAKSRWRDELMRRRRLKDEIAQLLEAGMASAPEPKAPRKPPTPVRLRGHRPFTLSDIESAIATGRE